MINRKLVAALRVLNLVLVKEEENRVLGNKRYKKRSKIIMDQLTDAEKKNLFTVMKSSILLTSGKVEVVRNPKAFNEENAQPWEEISPGHVIRFMKEYGVNPMEKVTKLDYILAKKIIPIVGQVSFTEEEAETFSKDLGTPGMKSAIQNQRGDVGRGDEDTSLLWRGLNTMRKRHILALSNIGLKWDLSRGVSTSTNKSTSKNFSLTDSGYRILFKIKNPSGGGFFARGFSHYTTEQEVILSGILEVKSWNLVETKERYLTVRLGDNDQYDTCVIKSLSLTNDNLSGTFLFKKGRVPTGDEKKINQPVNGQEALSQLLSSGIQITTEDGTTGTISGIDKYKDFILLNVDADWSPKEEPEEVNENYLRHARRSKMKLTKSQLKQIIKEELEQVTKEVESEDSLMEADAESAIAELTAAMQVPMTSGGDKRKKRK